MHYNRLAHIWEHLSKAFQYCYAAWHHEQSPISECVMHHSSIHLSEQAWSLPVSPNKYWNINVILCLCLCLPCFDFYSRNQFDFINDEINFQQSNCTLNFMICCWHVAKTLTEYFRYLSHEFSHSIHFTCALNSISLFAAFNYSGGYFNPVLATALKWGCGGNSHIDHLIVYWLGACVGAILSVPLYKYDVIKKLVCFGNTKTKSRLILYYCIRILFHYFH